MKKKEYQPLPAAGKKSIENTKKIIQADKKLPSRSTERNMRLFAKDPEEWRIED